MQMQMQLLGPVGLDVRGVQIDVGGPRAQAVLALLAVRANDVVSADWLVDQVWGERPPRGARGALQSYVSRLRRVAVPDSERMLPRHPRGYRLDASTVDIDVARFVRLSEQAGDQATAGRWRDSRGSLRSALALWRGTPFTGIDEVPALLVERARLEERRIETQFSELEAALEAGDPVDLIGSLREFTDAHPWRERGWRLLMLALYRAGRQTEALEVGRRARRLFVREQGLEPSHELAQLERLILTRDAVLDAAPRPIEARRWPGVPVAPLIGRDRELTDLLAQWEVSIRARRSRLVIVRGEPGVGKSHLVAELGRVIEARGDGVVIGRCFDEPRLPLQPWSDLLPTIGLPTPDVPQPPGDSALLVDVWETGAHRLLAAVTEYLRNALRAGPALMVVEDLHWAGVVALRLLDRVLGSCADLPLLVVATVRSTASGMTRATKGALGELTARTQPFQLHLEGLGAVELQAMLASHGHRLSEQQASSVCEYTGGVPLLAVEAVHGGEGVLDARMAGLSNAATGVVELLAVAGGSVAFALLRCASGLVEEILATALDELIATGLVRVKAGLTVTFELTHVLYRDAIQAQLSDPRRLVLSRRVLTASEVLPRAVGPATVAHHALVVARSGMPDDILRAQEESRRAAAWGTALHEHDEAVLNDSPSEDVATGRRRSGVRTILSVAGSGRSCPCATCAPGVTANTGPTPA